LQIAFPADLGDRADAANKGVYAILRLMAAGPHWASFDISSELPN
jgi:hypothetical protein